MSVHSLAGLLIIHLAASSLSLGPAQATSAQATRPLDPAVKRDGWWIRINKQSKAGKITWRFSDPAKKAEPAVLTWQRANDPDNFDLPEAVRLIRNIDVSIDIEPAGAVASVCLFYAQQGAQLLEVSKSARKVVDSRARDKNCVP